jgi:integrase
MPRRAKGARLWYDPKLGLWYIRDGEKKRGTGCGEGERQRAEAALQAYIADKYEPIGSSRPSEVTVDDVLTFYTREAAATHRSPTAAYAVECLLPFWSGKTLSDVKRSSCAAYVSARMKEPIRQAKTAEAKKRKVSKETARRELGVLRAAIRAYHAEFMLDAVPVVTLPEAAAPRSRWLTRGEVAVMLRACRRLPDKSARAAMIRFILIGVYTGTRSGAIRALGWMPNTIGGWVDVQAGVMHRRPDAETESNKRRPPVRVPPSLLRRMRAWERADAAILDSGTGRRKGIWVIHDRGERLLSQRKTWDAVRTAAKLGDDVTPHILRHTAATWLMQARADVDDAANFLGMSRKMLEDVYLHHHPDFQGDVAAKAGKGRKIGVSV